MRTSTPRRTPGLGNFDYGDDQYRVNQIAERVHVEHLVVSKRDDEGSPTAVRECCMTVVEITDADRVGPDPNPLVNALARANREIEARHGR